MPDGCSGGSAIEIELPRGPAAASETAHSETANESAKIDVTKDLATSLAASAITEPWDGE